VSLSGTGMSSSPAIVSPAAGSVLPGTTATFTWTAGSGVATYQLWVGTTGVGSSNIGIYSSPSATGNTVSVAVTGLPSNGGTVYATLAWEVGSSWYNNSANYTFTGFTGTASMSAISCASSSMSGSGSDACTVTLTTAAPAGGAAVNLTSSNSAVTVPASLTIPAGASSASFTATVASVTSAQTASLTASEGGASASFAVQVNPSTPTLSLSAASMGFGSVALNSPSTQSLTLSSTGSAAVTVNSATLSGAGFSISGASFPLTLNAGQSATLEVEFDPATAGAATGTLTIASNSSTGATAIVNLTGTGNSSTYQVSLSWNPANCPLDSISGYNVYRADSGSSMYQLLTSSVDTATTYVDTTVQAGATYDYYVETVDLSGASSAPSSVVPMAIP
jgi:centrosomal CEP192-like protein